MNVFWYLTNHYTFIFLILSYGAVSSIRVGSISNTKFISGTDQVYLNLSSWDCTCMALINLFVAWNYLAESRLCNPIRNYSSNDTGIQAMDNATFFFRELPPQPLTTNAMTTMSTSMYKNHNVMRMYKSYF